MQRAPADQAGGARGPLSFRSRVAGWWRRYWWVFSAVVGAVAFGLGYAGWDGTGGEPSSPPDRIYATLGLFRFGTVGTPPYPALIEVARWLAPLATASAFLRAVTAVFTEQTARLRVRLAARDHVVICGLGRVGLRLALAFRERGEAVVVIETAPAPADLVTCRDAGAVVVRGDATDEQVLRWARLEKARRIVAVCGDDSVNARVAMASQALAQRRQRPLACLVHISDEPLCRLLEEALMDGSGDPFLRLEYFNVFRAAARALLDAFPGTIEERAGEPPAILVAGGGRITADIVVESCRQWVLARREPGRLLRITMVGPQASQACERLQGRYRDLQAACRLTAVDAVVSDQEAPRLVLPSSVSAAAGLTAFVYEDDDLACLRSTLRLRQALDRDVRVVACTNSSSRLGSLVSGRSEGDLPRVETFELLEWLCTPEVVLHTNLELLAQAIHAVYLRHVDAAAPGDPSPARVPWRDLPETYRESNRDQAADITRKLAVLGCRVTPADALLPTGARLTDAEVELMARAEHDRWVAERLRDGWRHGRIRDEDERIHPDLVPWEDLDEPTRDKDRDPARNMIAVLAVAGFTVARSTPPAGQ